MRAPALLLVLGACTSPATFDTQVADATCSRLAECDPTAFDLLFEDAAACEERWSDGMSCFEEHCEVFDTRAATECLVAIRTADCDEAVDPAQDPVCTEVWSECSNLELLGCLASVLFGGSR